MAPQTLQQSRGHKNMMPVYVVLMSMLSLTARGAVTPVLNHHMATGQVNVIFSHTTQEMTTLGTVSSQTFTPSTAVPTLSTPQTPSEKPTAGPSTAQTAAYLSKSSSPSINNSTTGTEFAPVSTRSVSGEVTSSTIPTVTPTSSSESRRTNTTPTAPGTIPSTNVTPMTSTSTNPTPNDPTTTSKVASSPATPSTSSYKPSTSTTKRPLIHTTKNKNPNLGKKTEANTGKIVAGLIGGALVLMMVGFLVIYVKKRKLQKQQISTTNWAGPTPFLESGANNSKIMLRSSNRISISSFLPQRLSKRLSLLPEVGEEMEDITAASTFGEKSMNQTQSTKDSPKMGETSVTSSKADDPLFPKNEAEKDHQDPDESPLTPSGQVGGPPSEQTDDKEQP